MYISWGRGRRRDHRRPRRRTTGRTTKFRGRPKIGTTSNLVLRLASMGQGATAWRSDLASAVPEASVAHALETCFEPRDGPEAVPHTCRAGERAARRELTSDARRCAARRGLPSTSCSLDKTGPHSLAAAGRMERQKATTLTAACQASATAQLPQLNISEKEASSLRQHAGENTTIQVEWVVDVADNNLNWFVATAYSIDTVRRVLRVAIPDRDEPTWEGDLPLDPKTIHLLECCDSKSIALYKQCCREGSIKCKWTVEWCIDGAWFSGEALYYGRLANVVYCSDGRNVALHEVTIDENLRLVECLDDS